MGFLFGLLTAASGSFLTFQLASVAFANAGPTGRAAAAVLVAVACLGGFVAGSSAFRRARRSHENLGLFSGVAFSFWFAIVGGAFALSIMASYMRTYGTPGSGGADAVLTVLAYPLIGLFGVVSGAVVGWLLGLLASVSLRVLAPALR